MYFNEIDFPNQIIDAIRDGTLVVFAGAGASMGAPTSLPSFERLAQIIAEGTGKKLGKKDSCEVFLGSLQAEGIKVNQQAAEILSKECLKHNPLHEAIVDLFESDDKIKIVTTNYDKMFEQVVETRKGKTIIYNAPALPLGNDVEGIIHIHGNVDNPQYMVVTDEDFGRAYLTDGYASKFLVQLFASYTVLFVGYSYNDTIMRYLTRAISRNMSNKRYILTDARKNWSVLGIEPIYYKRRSYAVMREGLVKLGKAAKKGLLEWKMQLNAIKELPPNDLTGDTEIDYCLENDDRSQILANSVHNKEWMEYLERKNVFAECFSIDGEKTRKGELWADWLCKNFVGKDDEYLFILISTHKNIISKQFAESLMRKLLCATNIDTYSFMKYILILDNYLTDPWEISQLIEMLVKKEQFHSAFLLYRKLYDCKMLLEKRWFLQSDCVEYKHHFLGDFFIMESSWEIIKDKAIKEFPYEVVIFVIETIKRLYHKYEMAGEASRDKEPWDLMLLTLEDRDDHYRENPLRIMSKMLLDASRSLQNQNNELLKATLLQAISTESVLLKNMTLKVVREVMAFSPLEKLNILLNHNLISLTFCREQVYLLVAKIFKHLNNQDKERLLVEIDNLRHDKSNIYEVYNWYVWLQRIEPNNKTINKEIKKILIKNDFQPRENPEQIVSSSIIRWVDDQSPIPKEQMNKLPASTVINTLINYKESPIEGPSRTGLLNAFASVLNNDSKWGKQIIEGLIEEKVDTEDIWRHVFYGIREADYPLEDVLSILQLFTNNLDIIGYSEGPAQYLYKVLTRNDIKEFYSQNKESFYLVAETLWKKRKQETFDFKKAIDAAFNTAIGYILLSWVYMLSLNGERTIPERYKSHFEEAIRLRTNEKQIAVCILAGHLNFFCFQDMEWSKKVLIPLLAGKNKTLFPYAWEGMVRFSGGINKDIVDITAPIYYDAIKNITLLDDDTKNLFIEFLLTLMIYIVEKPTQKYIPEFYKNASIQDRNLFIQKIHHRLYSMNKDQKLEWWHAWLKHFLDNRKNNKPCVLDPDENVEIMNLLIVLPELFDEVVDIVCKGKTPEHVRRLFWYNISRMHMAKKAPHSMVKLLIKVLGNASDVSSGDDYIRLIAKELSGLEHKEQKALDEVLLKWNIDVDLA